MANTISISVVIPAHNEAVRIGQTLCGLLTHVATPQEIIVVLDHCTDATEQIVAAVRKAAPNITVLQNTKDKGFANTLTTGFLAAKGEAIIPVMADGCDDPKTVDLLWKTLEKGADVAVASRYMRGGKKRGGPMLQNILSRCVSYSLHLITGIPTWDAANSYKMYRKDLLLSLLPHAKSLGTEFSMELLFRAYRNSARIVEIPTEWHGRKTRLLHEWKILKRFPKYWPQYHKALLGRRH
jgi:glycosyltransferase involved in cell wall biosynthesis